MIKIVSITKEQKIYFMAMDPLMLMDRLDMAGMIALGAIEEKEDTKEVLPEGLLVCEKGQSSYKIHWLCVDQNHRSRGIGTELLGAVFDAAIRNGFPHVEAHILQTADWANYCPEEKSYLRNYYFTGYKKLPGEWHTTVGSLSGTFERIRLPEGSKVKALGELADNERKLILAKLLRLKQQVGKKSSLERDDLFDLELSRICYRNGRPAGGLLIQSIAVTDPKIVEEEFIPSDQRVLYPIFLAADRELDSISLIADSCKAAARIYPEDTKICVISHNESLHNFYDRLMPGCHVKSYSLIADVKDYEQGDEHAGEHYIL